MDTNNVIERLEPIFARIETMIRGHINSSVPFVSEVCQHILLSGGKRLRPALFVLSTHLCGRSDGREFELAPAVEYIHAATLLHDDVVDESDTRRGRKAAHKVFGNREVILVGDFLLAKSLSLGADSGIISFIDIMSKAVAQMSEGEVLQLLNAFDPKLTQDQYLDVVYRKTGILIECACRLGANWAKAPQEWEAALREYGRKIGIAFQIIDDCLDYQTTAEEFGKPVGHDLDEGKITLPIIHTLAAADQSDREELSDLVSKHQRTSDEFTRVRELIDKYSGLESANRFAADLINRAKQALEILPDGSEKTDLIDLADFIVRRRK
jgi:octaprenyl-diphosphate synthase